MMSKVQAMRKAIGDEAFVALGYAGVTHVGSVVQLGSLAVMETLRVHGVVGEHDGLTIIGSGVAMQAQAHVEDLLF